MENSRDGFGDSEISLEVKEAIRSYVLRLVIPGGAIFALLSFLLGFGVNDIAQNKAYMTAYADAYEAAMKSYGDVFAKSAARMADSESQAKFATLAMNDALKIAEQIKSAEAFVRSEGQISSIVDALSNNQEFISKVSSPFHARISATNKWLLNIYSQASATGMPSHPGANGWWQKSLIDAHVPISQELK